MYCRSIRFNLATLIVSCVSAQQPLTPLKQQYVIGGYIPGTPDLFLKKWTPILQNYLTRTIGPLYDPPISFKLIPIDYTKDTQGSELVRSGAELDFVCEC